LWSAVTPAARIIKLVLKHLSFFLLGATGQLCAEALDICQSALDVGLAFAVEAQELVAD